MPHLIIERLRTFPEVCTCTFRSRKGFPLGAYIIEGLDIFAGITFVVGSVCFLPPYAHNLTVFLWGCALYIVGSLIFVVICTYTLVEAVSEKGWVSFETLENGLYMLASWIFAWGTVLYWPSEADHEAIESLQQCSLPQYYNLFSPEFEGTLLFILGSIMFAFAAFTNALNQRRFDELESKLLTAITSLYMTGSLLFVMGSVAFLPDLGCNEQMMKIGAWCFIIGSVFFVIGGCLSLWRTTIVLHSDEIEELTKDSKESSA
jgi:hypothetical protein